ncbi:hypothetical protein AGDE_15972 [Angomonas deanei]|uniref:Uncharacterized protein n=1 Tax=Angomonas deanei TaxID=59799 RepID=A0A7G2CNE5_9TRYP|nr:hypothetical protein AGDE_15972 [Angomonas deanei]CAD2220607.1 hypothetical protein, conserved [Angomonas deanei]|eukprot:EPY17994.1 hypothetical protein AGDE_15972 [Angomonas deanei]
MLSPSGFSDTLPTAPRPTRPQWMEQGVESDEDAVVPLDLGVRDTLVASSPTPSRPSALSPTPRKAFVDEEDPLREESVPHHGSRTTTSSSSGSRQSQSVAPAAPSKKSKRYTDFDDSDEDD